MMNNTRYADELIAFALKEAELGTSVDEIYRKMEVSDTIITLCKRSLTV